MEAFCLRCARGIDGFDDGLALDREGMIALTAKNGEANSADTNGIPSAKKAFREWVIVAQLRGKMKALVDGWEISGQVTNWISVLRLESMLTCVKVNLLALEIIR